MSYYYCFDCYDDYCGGMGLSLEASWGLGFGVRARDFGVGCSGFELLVVEG